MFQVRISQLVFAAGVAAAGLVGFGGVADAATRATTAAVTCVNNDGVMELTITNPAADVNTEFVVTNPATFVASVIDLAPGASQVVTIDGLPDGPVVVPVQFNGNDESVSALISCDALSCAEGALTVVVDDSGVQHEACVASAVAVPPATSAKATFVPPIENAPVTGPVALPQTGTGTTGGLVIAALLVGCGSVASILSRRKR